MASSLMSQDSGICCPVRVTVTIPQGDFPSTLSASRSCAAGKRFDEKEEEEEEDQHSKLGLEEGEKGGWEGGGRVFDYLGLETVRLASQLI